jgi:hypothetical protein
MSIAKHRAEQATAVLERVKNDDNAHVSNALALVRALGHVREGLQDAARDALKQRDERLRVAFTRLGTAMTYEQFLGTRPSCPTKFGRENCTLPWGHTEVECSAPGSTPPPGYPIFDLAEWAK